MVKGERGIGNRMDSKPGRRVRGGVREMDGHSPGFSELSVVSRSEDERLLLLVRRRVHGFSGEARDSALAR